MSLWLWDIQFQKNLFKTVTVLCLFNCLAIGADDLYATVNQRLRQVDGRLSAKRSNDAFRLFKVDDGHDIFRCQRLKIQFVRSRIVCGNRLRVIVDDDRLISGTFDRLHGMDSGIVKFHALTDTDRSGAKHDDLLFI